MKLTITLDDDLARKLKRSRGSKTVGREINERLKLTFAKPEVVRMPHGGKVK